MLLTPRAERWQSNFFLKSSQLLLDGQIVLAAWCLIVESHEELSSNHFFSIVRAQKTLGLVNGTPDYTAVFGFEVPDTPARIQNYSADGRLYAYALPTVWVSASACPTVTSNTYTDHIFIYSGFAYSRQRVLNCYKNFSFLTLSTSSSRLVVLTSQLGSDLVRQIHPSNHARESNYQLFFF